MLDIQQIAQRFTLSFARSDDVQIFDTPELAGRAFAGAPAELGPRIIETRNGAARTIARSMRTHSGAMAKAAPTLDRIQADTQTLDLAFWTAYHTEH